MSRAEAVIHGEIPLPALFPVFMEVESLSGSWSSVRRQSCSGGICILVSAAHLSPLRLWLSRGLLGNARGPALASRGSSACGKFVWTQPLPQGARDAWSLETLQPVAQRQLPGHGHARSALLHSGIYLGNSLKVCYPLITWL